MIIGVPAESGSNECRVAATPDSVRKLTKLGYKVIVQNGCGQKASFSDDKYKEAGADIASSAKQIWSESDIVIKVEPPGESDVDLMKPNSTLISFVWPAQNEKLTAKLKQKNVSTLAMDCVPRISRAQKLDALSSMANIAGYRAIIESANEFGSFFTGQITAAGKVPPAKVLVIGAGVAGLSAIGTANSLGAVVRSFDTRPSVQEQVESMGAEFLLLDFEEDGEGSGGYAKTMSKEFIDAEMALFAEQAKEVDIIVTTALIPGKPAPKLITAEMVKLMKSGSVIVDLAAQNGGNCELTKPGQKTVAHDVTIIGYTDLPSRLPTQSSVLYSNNIVNLLSDMTPDKEGSIDIDLDDQVVRGTLVTHNGEMMWPPPKIEDPSPKPKTETKAAAESVPFEKKTSKQKDLIVAGVMGALMLGLLSLIGWYAPPDFVGHLTVFVLSCFIGWQVIWNVNPALHTPLMSVTNAISGIIIIGGMLQFISPAYHISTLLAFLAVLIAMINVVGGFYVTQRMLAMFRRGE